MNLTISTQDFTGKKLSDVQKKVKNPAGLKELEYVLAHPDEFPEMKDDNYYFFFGAAAGKRVPYLYWFGARFLRYSYWLEDGWLSDYRAVLRDSDLDAARITPSV